MESRIIHGDCIEVMKGMEAESVDVILCDPPYGIDFQSNMRVDKSKRLRKIINDKTPFVAWTDGAFRVLKDGGCVLCFTRWDVESEFRRALDASGFKTKQQIIWDKCIHGMGDLHGDFGSQHENIIFATKGKFRFQGKRPTSVFRHQKIAPMHLVHPNEKPVTLLVDLVLAVSVPGQMVMDCFAGSGSTGIACAITGREYTMIEQDDQYYNLIVRRLNSMHTKIREDENA